MRVIVVGQWLFVIGIQKHAAVDFVVELGTCAAYSQKALPRKSPRSSVGFMSFIRFDVVYIINIIISVRNEAWSPENTSKAVTHPARPTAAN